MFWTKSKRIIQIYFFISLFLFSACSSEKENQEIDKEEKAVLTEEEQIIRQVENKLGISAAEEYDIQILYKFINPDTLQDALILVNRKDHAFQRAKINNSERFFENTGYTAPHNHVFVKLGGLKNIIETTAVGSNVNYPLEAKFIELTSKAHQDFYVDYRIRNSLQRNYYTVRNNSIFKTFSCPVFDSIGADIPKVYDIQHKVSSVRIAKDIALYQGEILDYNPEEITDVNNYTPKEIIGTDNLFVYFIFDQQSMKYKTPMNNKVGEE
ncbi:MAG TPA: hypothetical protein VKY37_12450 [Brumimicrobium sp.]|nr:hypothetical protein [Brumimicrobium sp.]